MKTEMEFLYCGSFDPFTKGHLNVIEKALRIFPVVKILVLDNGNKAHTFNQQQRVQIAELSLDWLLPFDTSIFTPVESFKGNLIDYTKQYPDKEFTLIRGIRNEGDFRYEAGLCQYYDDIGLNVVYITPDAVVSNVSSTLARYHLIDLDQNTDYKNQPLSQYLCNEQVFDYIKNKMF